MSSSPTSKPGRSTRRDDWKVTPGLTINLGIRYELFSPIGERRARQSNFVHSTAFRPAPTLVIPEGPDQDAPLPPNFGTDFPDIVVGTRPGPTST